MVNENTPWPLIAVGNFFFHQSFFFHIYIYIYNNNIKMPNKTAIVETTVGSFTLELFTEQVLINNSNFALLFNYSI